MLWALKRIISARQYFEHRKQLLKVIDKKTLIVIHIKFLLILTRSSKMIRSFGEIPNLTSCEALSAKFAYSMDKCLNPFFSTNQVSLDPVAQEETGVGSLLIALKHRKTYSGLHN